MSEDTQDGEKYSKLKWGALILLFAALIYFGYVARKSMKENHTAQTEARITSLGTGCGSSHTVVKFAYTVGGRRFENWTCYHHNQIMEARYAVGSPAIACYDPSDPKDSAVIPPKGYSCGK